MKAQIQDAGGRLAARVIDARIALTRAERKRRLEMDCRGKDTNFTQRNAEALRAVPYNQTIRFVKIQWLEDSIQAGRLLSTEDYLVDQGEITVSKKRKILEN